MGEGVLTRARPPYPRVGGVHVVSPVREDGRATLVRRRERYSDLIRGQTP